VIKVKYSKVRLSFIYNTRDKSKRNRKVFIIKVLYNITNNKIIKNRMIKL